MRPVVRQARFFLERAVLRGAAAVVPWLPYEVLRGAAWCLGWAAGVADRRGRMAAEENLRVAFPALGRRERSMLRRRSYQTFARTFLELFWARRVMPTNEAGHFCRHFASEAAHQAVEEGCIFATAHLANFEWLSLAAAMGGFPAMIVAENFKNAALTGLFRRLRETGGHLLIAQENAIVRLFKHLRRGGRVAVLVDLNIPPDQSATVIECFGLKTCVTVGHAALAQRSGRPMIPCYAVPLPDGRYEMRFLDPIHVREGDSLQAACQQCWDHFEAAIRQQPEIWMWMYKHWRYLPEEAAAGDYPAYANRSKKFDLLLREAGGGPNARQA
ncbi:MAG: lysophospholipid acyltransferase family protein [Verrucomicrobiales bacterium]|nr:lysophospholipid acyltransferase family protein [Verrucomicrobiales bacterium]